MSCGVGRRYGSDLVLLWLWCRLVATAPIRPLVWEPPHATNAALKKDKKKKKSNSRVPSKNYLGNKSIVSISEVWAKFSGFRYKFA